MSTRGQAADTPTSGRCGSKGRVTGSSWREKPAGGGVSWRSGVAGVFVAYGVIGACIGIAAAVLQGELRRRTATTKRSPTTPEASRRLRPLDRR